MKNSETPKGNGELYLAATIKSKKGLETDSCTVSA